MFIVLLPVNREKIAAELAVAVVFAVADLAVDHSRMVHGRMTMVVVAVELSLLHREYRMGAGGARVAVSCYRS